VGEEGSGRGNAGAGNPGGAEKSSGGSNSFDVALHMQKTPGERLEKFKRMLDAGVPGNTVRTRMRSEKIPAPVVEEFFHEHHQRLRAEILSLLNTMGEGRYAWSLENSRLNNKSIVTVVRRDGETFRVEGILTNNSFLHVLGFTDRSSTLQVHIAPRNPGSLMRIRIPPGFYTNPPSLIASAVERAIQGRCALLATQETVNGHTFTLSLLDATFNQTIQVPSGVYTPEKLVDTIQTLMTGVRLSMEHVSPLGLQDVGWVRYTFEAEQPFPFVIDFQSKASAQLAFTLGFENRRYSSKTVYVGECIAVAAKRNAAPCPPMTPEDTAQLRAPVSVPRPGVRYPHGLYTIIGTTPSTQRFHLVSEPGKSWVVPNKLKEKTYFNNVEGRGVVDLTTRALQRQVSYDFREGDVVRLTGFHESEQTFSVAAQCLSGPTGKRRSPTYTPTFWGAGVTADLRP
jgi:hypothetical protein